MQSSIKSRIFHTLPTEQTGSERRLAKLNKLGNLAQ